jgi:hydroxyethylthiazole kinase
MKIAAKAASKRKIPIVLDPVGAGATKLRTNTVLRILGDYPVSIVKGNAGEIASLAGIGGKVRGVDSVGGAQMEGAVALAKRFATVVAVTGAEDFVSDGKRVLKVSNGSTWLGTITGSGCSATSVVAAFAGVGSNYVESAASALAVYSVAAEQAERRNPEGPATFKRYFFDSLYSITDEQVKTAARIEEIK